MNTPTPRSPTLVTIIVRNADSQQLAVTLESIARQTYPDIEIVVVDMQVSEPGEPILQCGSFFVHRINCHGKSMTPAAAANAGLQAAHGDWITVLDSGVELYLEHVHQLVAALNDHPDAVAAYTRIRTIDSDGTVLNEQGAPFDPVDLYSGHLLSIHSLLFRRRFIEAGASFDESLAEYADWDFCLQLAQWGGFVFIDALTAIHRVTDRVKQSAPDNAEAERAIWVKWQSRMQSEVFQELVRRVCAGMNWQSVRSEENTPDAEVERLQRELEDQSDQLAALEQKLDSTIALYENSRSWRITSPLRKLGTHWLRIRLAWQGFYLLNRPMQFKVLGWLLSGQFAQVRRALVLALQQKSAKSVHSVQPVVASLRMHRTLPSLPPLPAKVDVIIPVYNGFEYLESLFDSLAQARSSPFRLLVANDASPDQRIQPWLERCLQDFPDAVLLHNDSNLGFVGTVNRLFEHVTHDFVLLNSDVQVPPFWLERLFAPMLTNPQVASVTPFTNAGAICSFPYFFTDNELPQGMQATEVDGVLGRLADAVAIDISTGVGFCMAIRLEVAKRIGMFDPVFGMGYREENDWCQRARLLGYRHVMVPNLFVYHKHGGSFPSQQRQALADRNERILLERYPGLFDEYHDFIGRDPVRPVRDFLYLMVLAKQAQQPALVVIDNVIEGGAFAYCQELIANTLKAGTPVLHLLDDCRTGELRAEWKSRSAQLNLHFQDYPDWERVIEGIQPGSILINNIYSYRRPMDFLHWLGNPAMLKEIPVHIALHDFLMLCPSLFLIDSERKYCGLPESTICNQCYSRLPLDFPGGAHTITEWRMSWEKVFARAETLVAFSNSTRELYARIYPEHATKIVVRPHSMTHFHHWAVTVDLNKPLHIGIVGTIGWQKGWNIVRQLCEVIDAQNLPYQITVIGAMVPAFSAQCLNETGRYDKTKLPSLIAQSGANIFLFPSIWPETFSYVTHELVACGVPLCCFDLGAPAETLEHYAAGMVLRRDSSALEMLTQMEQFRVRLSSRTEQ